MPTPNRRPKNPLRIMAWIALVWGVCMPVSDVVYRLLGYGEGYSSTRVTQTLIILSVGLIGLMLTSRK